MSRVGDVLGRLQSNVHGLVNELLHNGDSHEYSRSKSDGVDERHLAPDTDLEEDLYFEDEFAHQKRKEDLLTQQCGYMYVKVRSHILPFLYR